MASYTKEETEFLIQNHSTMTFKEMAKHLNRSQHSVREKAAKLNLSKYKMHDNLINDIVRLFIKYYCTTERTETRGQTYELIAKELGTTRKTIEINISQHFPLAVSKIPARQP